MNWNQEKKISSKHPIDQLVKNCMDDEVPGDVVQSAERLVRAQVQQIREGSLRRVRNGWWNRLIWSGTGALGCAVVGLLALGLTIYRSPSWADVVERFKSVNFFSATLIITEDPLAQPERMELWVSSDGRSRVHHRNHVLFGRDGEILAAFDVKAGKAIDPKEMIEAKHLRRHAHTWPGNIIQSYGSMREFSLEALMSRFCGNVEFSSPLKNAEAFISDDMEVFDAKREGSPEWLRIWVLKSSRLPVRMRYWDPRRGESVDVFFEYMQPQPSEAFDPDAFQEALAKAGKRANALYNLLKDPGGEPLTPAELFEVTGYHLPEVLEVGRTDDGVVWVKSGKARNRMPDGYIFDGFGKLTDNLGRAYLYRSLGHRVKGDICLEYFIPLDYGLDIKDATGYTLTCWNKADYPTVNPVVEVGSISIDEWQEDTLVPDLFGNAPSNSDFLQAVIHEWRYRHQWDRFDQLLAQIPGEPETDDRAFFREEQRLHKLVAMGRSEEVFQLSERLWKIVEKDFAENLWRNGFIACQYITQLIEHGKREEAQSLARRMVQESYGSKHPDAADYFLVDLVSALARQRFSLEEVNAFLDMQVEQNAKVAQRIREMPGFFPADILQSKALKPWRDYIEKIAPQIPNEAFQKPVFFPQGLKPFSEHERIAEFSLPGRDGWMISMVKGDWESILRNQAYRQGWDPARIRVDSSLQKEPFNQVAIYREGEDYYRAFVAWKGLEIVEEPVQHKVWAARYDGRSLPYFRDVLPLSEDTLGDSLVMRGGGLQTTAKRLLWHFQDAVNSADKDLSLTNDKVFIIDETGLPDKPGENQTWGTICLSYNYAFGKGERATELAKEWFEKNFGITFHEETRMVEVLRLKKK